MKALVDASTLLLLLKHMDGRKLADIASDLSTLDVAVYEASNGIWKQVRLLNLLTRDDARKAHSALLRLASRISLVRWDEVDHAEAMDVAITRGVAYYDACYLVAAKSLGLPLATDDRKLTSAASEQKVLGWKELAETT
ncbi:MAG: type II toxin-antitoxin system VapC family toxin [Nitrososphaerales archaeon]|nr:type II toxin-antitoxin system VapC family toxin [Nitrososphaerales archaeon]